MGDGVSDFYPPYVPVPSKGMPFTILRIAPQLAKILAHLVAETIRNQAGKVRVEKYIYHEKSLQEIALRRETNRNLYIPPPDEEYKPEEIVPTKWASLGDFEFDILAAPKKFTGTEGVTYAQHAIIGGKPHVQYTGTKLRTVVLTLGWHTAFMKDIEASYEKLREAMNTQQIMRLVIGDIKTGCYYDGDWVIESIPYTVERFNPDGSLMKLELTLNLLEWNTGKPLEPGEHAPCEGIKKQNSSASQKASTTTATGKVGSNMVGSTGRMIGDGRD